MTQLVKHAHGYTILRGYASSMKQIECQDEVHATKLLEDIGIGYFEIEDALASMLESKTNAVEFGLNNTFIRCLNTTLHMKGKIANG